MTLSNNPILKIGGSIKSWIAIVMLCVAGCIGIGMAYSDAVNKYDDLVEDFDGMDKRIGIIESNIALILAILKEERLETAVLQKDLKELTESVTNFVGVVEANAWKIDALRVVYNCYFSGQSFNVCVDIFNGLGDWVDKGGREG